MLLVLFSLDGMLMMTQCLVITMSWFGTNQLNTDTVLRLILINHILLATATTLTLESAHETEKLYANSLASMISTLFLPQFMKLRSN